MTTLIKKVFYFYYDGFRNMTVGKRLWLIIFIKLFFIFVILKLFFFPDFLKTNFSSQQQRSDYVLEQLTSPQHKN